MNIIDLTEDKKDLFCLCLEDWSEEAKEAGPKRRRWLDRCEKHGLRARRAAAEFGDKVAFCEIDTSARSAVAECGVSDAVLVDGKNLQKGPPPSYEKIRRAIAKRLR